MWDLDETIIVFHSLLTGSYAQKYGKVRQLNSFTVSGIVVGKKKKSRFRNVVRSGTSTILSTSGM